MQLIAIGVNHVTAPIALREKFAIPAERESETVQALSQQMNRSGNSGSECLILSTCNRTEIVACTELDSRVLLEWLAEYAGESLESVARHTYIHHGEGAFAHLVRVASGLDSMVLGEPQIFGQMKSAYAVARERNTLGSDLERAFQQVFSAAKKVRNGTAIGKNPVSVAYAAVGLAQRIFHDMREVSVLLVGAGETINLVAQHLAEVGASQMTVANRTLDKANLLAKRFSAQAMLLSDLPEKLAGYDVVITSTASQLPIIGKGMVEQAMKVRKRKPMFVVDIAVPRDVEPQVESVRDVYLYTVDDLKDIVDQNKLLREKEVDKAAEIIDTSVAEFISRQRSRGAVDLVVAYRKSVELVSNNELEKAKQMLEAGESAESVLALYARALTRKLMHQPTVAMRAAASEGDQALLEAAKKLLDLSSE